MLETTGVASHPQKASIEQMWREGHRTKHILNWLDDNEYAPIKPGTLESYGRRYWTEDVSVDLDLSDDNDVDSDTAAIRKMLDDLKADGLNAKEITIERKSYPGWTRENPDDPATSSIQESQTHRVKITTGPEVSGVSPLDPAPDLNITVGDVRKWSGENENQCVVFYPDMQVGYWRGSDGLLVESHDEDAIDVAHQITMFLQEDFGVDYVINAGDNADFPEFSTKHMSAPGFWQTTQLTINRLAREAAIQRALAPDAQITWLEGNHEARLTKFLVDRAPQLLGLTKAEESEPIISLPSLCNFDKHGVEFLSGYPDACKWIDGRMRFVHGDLYSATPGATAAKYLAPNVSTLHGHTHRREYLEKTVNMVDGPHTTFAGSPGALCRIDGAVPSTKTGITIEGTQACQTVENWQQGIAIVWIPQDGDPHCEMVSIRNGIAIYGGQTFTSSIESIRQTRGY